MRWTEKGCLECRNHKVSDTKLHYFVLYIWTAHCNQTLVLAHLVTKRPILTKRTDTIFSLCIFPTQSTGPRLIQLVLKPFNWSLNSSTGSFSAKMANFDKTNWYYLFIVYPSDPVNWPQAHSTGPQPIQLVPKNCLLQKSHYRSLKSKNSKT